MFAMFVVQHEIYDNYLRHVLYRSVELFSCSYGIVQKYLLA